MKWKIETQKRPAHVPTEWAIFQQKQRRAILAMHHNILMRGHQQELNRVAATRLHQAMYDRYRPGLREPLGQLY